MFVMVIPFLAFITAKSDRCKFIVFAIMLFFTCTMQAIHIAPLPEWTGTARGFAFTMVDICCLGLFLGMCFDKRCPVKKIPTGAWLFFIYFAFILLSGINAPYKLQWGFEVLKMFWMYLFFVTSYNFILHYKSLWPIMYVICVIVFFMFCVGFYQKYLSGGRYQIPSTMPHQNSMTLYLELFGCIILGVLLNEKLNALRTMILLTGFFSSLLLLLFSFSRGGLVCFLFAIMLVALLSVVLGGFSMQKMSFILLGVVGGSILLTLAMPRIIQRFEKAPEASKNTRIYLAYAATRMANDYKLGVGANNFSAFSGPFEKYAVEMYENTKINEEESDPYGGVVETIYLLVAAECGWGGLVALLVWFIYYWMVSFNNMMFLRCHETFGVAIGCTFGLLANYFQSAIEWSLKQYNNFYELMFVFALVAALSVYRKRMMGKK